MYLQSRRTAQGVALDLTGSWRLPELDAFTRELAAVQLDGATQVLIDTTGLTALDLSASVKLRDFMRRAAAAGASVEFVGPPPDQLRLIETAMGEPAPLPHPEVPGPHHIE